MTPQIEAAFTALEKSRGKLFSQLANLTPEQLACQPRPEKWCILEVIHHLILVEQATYQYMIRKNRAEQLPNIPLMSALRFRLLAIILRLPLKFKIPTEAVRPQANKTLEELNREWEDVRSQLRQFVAQLPPERKNAAIYRHPVGGRLTINHALKFIHTHFKHHLTQIRRIEKEISRKGI